MKRLKRFLIIWGLKKIPTVKELQTEYATLVGEKQTGILERDQLKKQLSDLQSVQKNVYALLDLPVKESGERQDSHETR